MGFYKQLLGSMEWFWHRYISKTPSPAKQLPAINPNVMRDDPVLNRKQQLLLIAHIISEEIYQGLKDISDHKAPRCDVFDAMFFKKACPIIGNEVTAAVQEVFSKVNLYRAINCTTVTLILKVANPSKITEYIPIS